MSPGHFLIGEPVTQLPSDDYTNVKCNRLSTWQTYQQQLQQFWQRWSFDYLQNLQQRQRWQRASPNLKPCDLVLLKEDNTTPLHWPTAVITETHPGKDVIVRVVNFEPPTAPSNVPPQNLVHYRPLIVNNTSSLWRWQYVKAKNKFFANFVHFHLGLLLVLICIHTACVPDCTTLQCMLQYTPSVMHQR
jgi:hypothetical protein